jgi:hypothetical protein
MRLVDFFIILLSHALASLPFWHSIRLGKIPNTADFAVISLILYYDVGLVLEVLGYPYESLYFTSLFAADDATFLLATGLLVLAPWLFHAGSWVTNSSGVRRPQDPTSGLDPKKRSLFYFIVLAVSVLLALYSVVQLLPGEPLWFIRARVGLQLGPLLPVLYLPLYFLAFYIRQTDARTRWGLVFSFVLIGLNALTTIIIGARWTILLPFLLLAIFRFRLTVAKLPLVAVGVVVFASVFLTTFKLQYAEASLSLDKLVAATIAGDIARAGVLDTVVNLAEPVGTRVLPYPLAGYVYTALVFVPRPLAPFKGQATGTYVTGYLVGTNPAETNWTFGIGVIEELLVNVGVWLVIPGLFLYGMAMGLLDRATWRVPALVVPTRVGAIWLGGYDLAPTFVIFGIMALVGFVLHRLFGADRPLDTLAPDPPAAPARFAPDARLALEAGGAAIQSSAPRVE